MLNIHKQIDYWRTGSAEDRIVAAELFASGRIRHALFFLHLTLEKILKAHVCQYTKELAPRIHNLARLLEMTGLSYNDNDFRFLADLNKHNIEGRYPDAYEDLPTLEELNLIQIESERIYQWLLEQF